VLYGYVRLSLIYSCVGCRGSTEGCRDVQSTFDTRGLDEEMRLERDDLDVYRWYIFGYSKTIRVYEVPLKYRVSLFITFHFSSHQLNLFRIRKRSTM